MKNRFVYSRAVGVGVVNGFIFGLLCEIANRRYFEFQLRKLNEGGCCVDGMYPWSWWILPCFFLLVFAITSLFVHWLRSNRTVSITRLWQEIGFGSVIAWLLLMLIYNGLNGQQFFSSLIVKGLFLFGLAFIFNAILGRLLEKLSNNNMHRKENSIPKNAG